ncbi:DUF4232 domain-containing protein [Streptomyces virginiae]|uniref:DUF4232 domain-containing protein n=1 Tax=Streptomyces virginiae TaxID=1961 RepID=UPI00386864BF|nr:DUF4232 domain-containing protein [Streptomyces virginiae]
MIAKRRTRRRIPALVTAGVLAGVLAGASGCSAPPAPRTAPGPTAVSGTVRPAPDRSAPTAPTATAQACPEGGVRLVEGEGDAAMGLRVADFQLVNCGTQPYLLEGYPQLSLRDDRNDPLEVSVEHGSAGITTGTPNLDAAPQRVTLAPGQAAVFGIVWRNLVTDGTVVATTARVLEVEPRPGAPRLSLRLTSPVDLGNTGKLGLGPWLPLSR